MSGVNVRPYCACQSGTAGCSTYNDGSGHTLNGAHTRSISVVAAEISYSVVLLHTVAFRHTRSDVAVGATD